ncbi:MAG: P22 phage major capsid protein family protein [Nitrospinales bacterium]
MANTLGPMDPEFWAMESLIALENNLVMASLVHRDFENVVAKKGDVINTRQPQTFVANDMGSTVTVQDLAPTNVQLALTKWKEVTFVLGDKEQAFSVKDLVEEYIQPAMYALADQIDQDLCALYTDLTTSVGTAGTDVIADKVVDARKAMNDQKVPVGKWSVVLSPKDEASLLKEDKFTSANMVGDDGTALREASLGRRYGMDIFMDQNIVTVAGTPNTTYNMAFHKNAFALVMRPLVRNENMPGAKVSVTDYKGLGLRSAVWYEGKEKAVYVSIDALYAVKTLNPALGIQLLG